MLNRPLYNVLRRRFGEVRISNENQKRVEHGGTALVAGEQYAVCCPLCGDNKFRLTVSYLWLEKRPLSKERITTLANCYNENCAVRSPEFYEKIIDELDNAILAEIALPTPPEPEVVRPAIRLPGGCVSLADLPGTHPATLFVRGKYPFFPIDYLSTYYEVLYCPTADPLYPLAGERIIFPIRERGELVAWQGRTINPGTEPRWYLPPGMKKVVYNLDRVPPDSMPIICEGIPAAIACGPEAVAIFGKTMTDAQCRQLAARHRTCLIATDPDTFVLDPRGKPKVIHAHVLKKKLSHYLQAEPLLIRWPTHLLEQAELYVNKKAQSCPDAADLGYLVMKGIIDATITGRMAGGT